MKSSTESSIYKSGSLYMDRYDLKLLLYYCLKKVFISSETDINKKIIKNILNTKI